MLALLKKTIILLFLSSFTFICFSMNTHNNDFEEHLDPEYTIIMDKLKNKKCEQAEENNYQELPLQIDELEQ